MRKRPTLKIAVALAGAIVLAVMLGAAGAVAASRALSANDESKAVIDDAADRLGVTPAQLTNALKEALKARIDAAVASGRLTEEQGKELRQRIDEGETPLLFGALGRFGGPFGHNFGHMGQLGHFGKLETAASYLGLSETELLEQLRDGETLAEVAKSQGKSVDGLVQALVKDARQKLDAAVADGRLTRSQADAIANRLEATVTDLVNGKLPERPFGFRFGGGFRGPDGFGHFGMQPHRRGAQA